MQNYKRIGHIAIRTSDIDACLDFYCKKLGFTEAFRMHDDNGKLTTIYLNIAPGQFIEIFTGGIEKQETSINSIGYCHLCLEVENITETFKTLSARGIPIDREIKTGLSKCLMFWTHDPDGNSIEIMELTPESLQIKSQMKM